LLCKSLPQGSQNGVRAFDAHPGCDAAYNEQIASANVRKKSSIFSCFNGPHAKREIGLHLEDWRWSEETFWRHAHNRNWVSIDESRFAYYSRITLEACFPIPIAEDHDRIRTGRFPLGRKNKTPKVRSNAEHLEKIACNEERLNGPGGPLYSQSIGTTYPSQ
jgi:hypothetical protein